MSSLEYAGDVTGLLCLLKALQCIPLLLLQKTSMAPCPYFQGVLEAGGLRKKVASEAEWSARGVEGKAEQTWLRQGW